jgi:hypothetical protein
MSRPRRWPPARVAGALREECGLPDGASVERVGPLTCLCYRDNGLLRRLDIAPQQFTAGTLSWRVSVCAEAVRQETRALWTEYEPAPGLAFPVSEEPLRRFTGYPWPDSGAGLDPRLVRDAARFARPMLWFLADTRDLGTMLLHRNETGDAWITRGEVRGHRLGEGAAGAAGAVMLARATGNARLEAAALAKVASGEVSGLKVRYWAEQYREWSPVDISDLEHLRRPLRGVTGPGCFLRRD